MRIGSLFSGAGGLDLAALEMFDGSSMAWHCEVDSAAARVLAHRWPDVPNLGDITQVDWSTVEPVDVITGGFPCQDVSAAGLRAGLGEGTRSGLWSHMATAIDVLRPRYVLIENVRGLLSATAIREVESRPGTVGNRANGPVLRALGAVLGNLADLRFDADWMCLRAADVGAAHRRERVFILAHPQSDGRQGIDDGARRGPACGGGQRIVGRGTGLGAAANADSNSVRQQSEPESGRGGAAIAGRDRAADGAVKLLPTEAYTKGALLPTPRATDGTKGGPNQRGSSGDLMLPSAVVQLLPTPRASDGSGGPNPLERVERMDDVETRVIRLGDRWGDYAPAIARQELLSRPAPAPTELSVKGNPRLSPKFAEWLMFWPAGWVTDPAIGLSRNDQLRIIGNGVVPRQAVAAFRQLLCAASAPIEGAAS